MFTSPGKNDFQNHLLAWFKEYQRPLPWRGDTNPYKIWVTEVIFQQTRIEQGMGHYQRFISLFPDLQTLAKSTEDMVLKAWQGLGYYSRARNLLFSAQTIFREFDGVFPEEYDQIIRLKGIGDYIASAIVSICFGTPMAAVDGNVQRVICRLFAFGGDLKLQKNRKQVHQMAQNLLSEAQPGNFNEAMMDLGAIICKPTRPLCSICPVAVHCRALKEGQPHFFPKKSPAPLKRRRQLHYLYLNDDNHLLIQRREGSDIWKGLYELPLVEGDFDDQKVNEQFRAIIGDSRLRTEVSTTMNHILTHQKLQITFHEGTLSVHPTLSEENELIRVHICRIKEFAFPKPITEYLQRKLA